MSLKFPNPSGQHSVACLDITPSVGSDELFFRLFYPTPAYTPTEENSPLWCEDRNYIYGYSRFLDLSWLTGLMNWFIGNQKIPVLLEGALLSSDDPNKKFPVIVFSHGLGGNRTTSSYICYEMASHGFIVASIEHKDLSASATYSMHMKQSERDNSLQKYWMYMIKPSKEEDLGGHLLRNMQAQKRMVECVRCLNHLEDLNSGVLTNVLSKFDLQAFKGKLDLDKVIMMGHSFGGATSLLSLKADQRFKVGCMLDAWMEPIDQDLSKSLYQGNIAQPMLFVNSENFQDERACLCLGNIKPENVEKKKVYKLLGTTHQIFSDFSLILSDRIGKAFKTIGTTDSLTANKALIELMLKFIGNEMDLAFKGSIEAVVNKYNFLIDDLAGDTQSVQTPLIPK